jgi:hypothetical protein
MSLAATLPRALIAWLSSDRTHRQREPAVLVLIATAGAGRGQLGVRQALLPASRLPGSAAATSGKRECDGMQSQSHAGSHHGAVDPDVLQIAAKEQFQLA